MIATLVLFFIVALFVDMVIYAGFLNLMCAVFCAANTVDSWTIGNWGDVAVHGFMGVLNCYAFFRRGDEREDPPPQ